MSREEIERVFKQAYIIKAKYVGVLLRTPTGIKPEVIINYGYNFDNKADEYLENYEKIKIVKIILGDDFSKIAERLMEGMNEK